MALNYDIAELIVKKVDLYDLYNLYKVNYLFEEATRNHISKKFKNTQTYKEVGETDDIDLMIDEVIYHKELEDFKKHSYNIIRNVQYDVNDEEKDYVSNNEDLFKDCVAFFKKMLVKKLKLNNVDFSDFNVSWNLTRFRKDGESESVYETIVLTYIGGDKVYDVIIKTDYKNYVKRDNAKSVIFVQFTKATGFKTSNGVTVCIEF